MSLFQRPIAFLAIGCVTALLGCGEPAPQSGVPSAGKGFRQTSARKGPTSSSQASATLSLAEQQAFAERVERAVAERSVEQFDRCIDWVSVVGRAMKGLPVQEPDRSQLQKGMVAKFSQGSPFAKDLLANLGEDGTFRLLHLHERRGMPYALFRASSEAGTNYIDFRLAKKDSQAVASDMYAYILGDHISASIKQVLLPVAAQISKNWLQKLGSSDKAFFQEFDKLAALKLAVSQGNGAKALRIYQSCTSLMQELKPVQILRYQAASSVGKEELLDAYSDFEKLFPGDDALSLLALDAFVYQEEYEKALEAVDQLDKSVGGDPYLNIYRANINIMRGEHDEARRFAIAAVEGDPSFEENWSTLLDVMVAVQDHAGTLKALNKFEQDFGYSWHDLREVDDFSDFVASIEGLQWLADHGYLDAANDASLGAESSDSGSEATAIDQGYLTWADATGSFSVEAKLISRDDEIVELQRRDGRVIKVPLDKLSEQSRSQATAGPLASPLP